MEYLPLLGIAIVIVGFTLKWNSIGIVILAMFVTGLAGKMNLFMILDTIGKSFVSNRVMAIFILILPVIGLLEKSGLKETAAKLIMTIKQATPASVLIAYGILRSFLAAFNVGLGGVAGFVRPVVYPMQLASVEKSGKKIDSVDDDALKGMASAMENVAWFFGQVLFLGGSGMLLVKNTLEMSGYTIDPVLAVRAEIPVLACALLVSFSYFTYRSRKIMKKYSSSGRSHGGRRS